MPYELCPGCSNTGNEIECAIAPCFALPKIDSVISEEHLSAICSMVLVLCPTLATFEKIHMLQEGLALILHMGFEHSFEYTRQNLVRHQTSDL